jgi:hypothetical protein
MARKAPKPHVAAKYATSPDPAKTPPDDRHPSLCGAKNGTPYHWESEHPISRSKPHPIPNPMKSLPTPPFQQPTPQQDQQSAKRQTSSLLTNHTSTNSKPPFGDPKQLNGAEACILLLESDNPSIMT